MSEVKRAIVIDDSNPTTLDLFLERSGLTLDEWTRAKTNLALIDHDEFRPHDFCVLQHVLESPSSREI